jgi:hypothetical protein
MTRRNSPSTSTWDQEEPFAAVVDTDLGDQIGNRALALGEVGERLLLEELDLAEVEAAGEIGLGKLDDVAEEIAAGGLEDEIVRNRFVVQWSHVRSVDAWRFPAPVWEPERTAAGPRPAIDGKTHWDLAAIFGPISLDLLGPAPLERSWTVTLRDE